jgi:hypothetical protein
MNRLIRFLLRLRSFFTGASRPAPEIWCRPATVLALRDQARAPRCVAGWH